MSEPIPISQSTIQFLDRHWKRIAKTPAQQAAILAVLAGGAAWMTYPVAQDTVKSLARPFASKAGKGVQNTLLDDSKHSGLRRGIFTGAAALAAALASIGVTYNNRLTQGGSWDSFTQYNAQPAKALRKVSSYSPQMGPRMTQLLNTQAAMDLFRSDPILATYDPYAKNLGTSIIASAGNGARTTSLGSVFDSAVNKIESKLSFQGLANTALKTGTAYATASLFTNAVGAMLGLPRQTRDNIISAGTWAGAISSILE